MEEIGIKALPLNAQTLYNTAEEDCSLYEEVLKSCWEVVLIASERLIAKAFAKVICSSDFLKNLVLLIQSLED
ncbi:hypothetical protein C0991_001699, partial [Blastosporella zonata]